MSDDHDDGFGKLPPPPPNPDDNPGRGRPRKLTLPLILSAQTLLLTGLPERAVAKRLLVSQSTWSHWKKCGQDHPDGIYRQFLEAVVTAKAGFHAKAVRIVDAAMMDDAWLALAVLERRFPREWGKYRGELGDMKKRVKELEDLVAEKTKKAKSKVKR